MNITVIGCGRWGTTIAWYLDRMGHKVSLYGREGSKRLAQLKQYRENDFLKLGEKIDLTRDLKVLESSKVIIISINSQGLQKLVEDLKKEKIKDKIIVLCMKGIEVSTCRRLSQVVEDGLDDSNKVAVWLGPGHPQEFYRGIPNCMVIDSQDEKVKKMLVDSFSSDLIRFYYGNDLLGNEIGAAAKNVIGIAAGMLDGFGLSTLKGALMSRGTVEVARLIKAMGGSELSAYGLCHLGDYEATVFSKYSNNRRFGEAFVKKEDFDKLAEGYYTVKALLALAKKYRVELPISNVVYDILYNEADPKAALNSLFDRKIKHEF